MLVYFLPVLVNLTTIAKSKKILEFLSLWWAIRAWFRVQFGINSTHEWILIAQAKWNHTVYLSYHCADRGWTYCWFAGLKETIFESSQPWYLHVKVSSIDSIARRGYCIPFTLLKPLSIYAVCKELSAIVLCMVIPVNGWVCAINTVQGLLCEASL